MSITDISTLDINSISPDASFVLDANILFFLHSGFYTSSSPNASQISAYSRFIADLLKRGNQLYITTIALQDRKHDPTLWRLPQRMGFVPRCWDDIWRVPCFASIKGVANCNETWVL